jgi:hypothetical protein
MSFKADSPTFTGTVTVPTTPSNASDAASKDYVDKSAAKIRKGTANFTDEASKAVPLDPAFADTNYRITLTPADSVSVWYSDKAVDGFTIHTSANLSAGVDWVVVHD